MVSDRDYPVEYLQVINALTRERDAALALAEQRAAVLRKVEWYDAWGTMCPICGQYDFAGHVPDCALAAALRPPPTD
jgi:hypothetical protein